MEYSVFIVTFASGSLVNVVHSVITVENQAQDISRIRDKEPKHVEPITGTEPFSQLIAEIIADVKTNFTDHKWI